MDFQDEVAKTIEKFDLLTSGERMLVGVSGGADSLSLMHCLDALGYEVVVAHLDHQLRDESSQDAEYVRDIAAEMQLQFVSARAEINIPSTSIEESARIFRYSNFLRIAIEMDIKSIAVGHTADDQTETILMHFLRGAGPEGLRGMLPKRSMALWGSEPHSDSISLIRPLLKLPRSKIEAYCADVGLKPLRDPSNRDLTFSRNRMRHEILPMLKAYNPGLDNTLQHMADVMNTEVGFINEIVNEAISALNTRIEENTIIFDRKPFLQLHPAIQRAMFRRHIAFFKSQNGALGFEAIENTLQFVRSSDSWGVMELGSELKLQRLSEKVVIQSGLASPILSYFPQLAATQKLDPHTDLGSGWVIIVRKEKLSPELQKKVDENQDQSTAFLDESVLDQSPSLRTHRQGDRFQPLGMSGSLKLSDFFVNQKIPRPARKNWPLLATEEEIFWVVGLQISEHFRIQANTKRVLRLELVLL